MNLTLAVNSPPHGRQDEAGPDAAQGEILVGSVRLVEPRVGGTLGLQKTKAPEIWLHANQPENRAPPCQAIGSHKTEEVLLVGSDW